MRRASIFETLTGHGFASVKFPSTFLLLYFYPRGGEGKGGISQVLKGIVRQKYLPRTESKKYLDRVITPSKMLFGRESKGKAKDKYKKSRLRRKEKEGNSFFFWGKKQEKVRVSLVGGGKEREGWTAV